MADLKHTDVGTVLTEAEYDGGAAHYSGAIGDIIYASTATVLSGLADVAVGSVLISGGVGVAPSWSATPTVTGITVGATGVVTASGDLILNPDGNNITLAAKKLKFTDMLLKEGDYDMLQVRNAADTTYNGLRVGGIGLWIMGFGLGFDTTGLSIETNNVDDYYFMLRARDNGVTMVEVARIQGAAEPRFAHTRPVNLLGAAAAELTIATGAITIIAGFNTVDTEGDAASDDLDTISGGRTGDIYVFAPANAARTVVAKHGTGNLNLSGGADFTMDEDDDFLMLLLVGATWQEINRSENHA